jgi:hypothetical protein
MPAPTTTPIDRMAVPVVELWTVSKVFVTVRTSKGAEPTATMMGPQSKAGRTGIRAKRLVKLCWGDVMRSATSTATRYPQAKTVEQYLSTSAGPIFVRGHRAAF